MTLQEYFTLDEFIKIGLGIGAVFQVACLVAAFYLNVNESDGKNESDLTTFGTAVDVSPSTTHQRSSCSKKNRIDKKKRR